MSITRCRMAWCYKNALVFDINSNIIEPISLRNSQEVIAWRKPPNMDGK